MENQRVVIQTREVTLRETNGENANIGTLAELGTRNMDNSFPVIGRGRGRGRGRPISPNRDMGNSIGSNSHGVVPGIYRPSLSVESQLLHNPVDEIIPVRGRGRARRAVSSLLQVGQPICLESPVDSTSYPFTASLLRRCQELDSYSKSDTFIITGALTTNTIHIHAKDTYILDFLLLQDAINLCIDKLPTLDQIPNVGDIILATRKFDKIANFLRVEVMDTSAGPNMEWIRVKRVDTGLPFVTQWATAKKISNDIMRIPLLGFDIQLQEVPNVCPKILYEDFLELIARHSMVETEFKLVSHPGGLYSLISCVSQKSLAKEILQLGKWQWEVIASDPYRCNDESIKLNGDWEEYPENIVCAPAGLPLNEYFMAEIATSRFSTDSKNSLDYYTIYIHPLTPAWIGVQKTLEAQIESYIRTVSPSPFYPALNESVLVKFPEEHPDGCNGKWHRMLYIDVTSDAFYDVDRSITFHIPRNDDSYEYRMLQMEFNRIPMLVLDVGIFGLSTGNDEVRAIAQRLFKMKNKLYFRINQSDQRLLEEEELTVVRCFEFEQELALVQQSA